MGSCAVSGGVGYILCGTASGGEIAERPAKERISVGAAYGERAECHFSNLRHEPLVLMVADHIPGRGQPGSHVHVYAPRRESRRSIRYHFTAPWFISAHAVPHRTAPHWTRSSPLDIGRLGREGEGRDEDRWSAGVGR